MMQLLMAIKNVRAHVKHSIVTISLTMAATALLVFSSAFMDGSHNKMIESAVEIYPGYLQITQQDFRETPSFDNLIFDAGAVSDILAESDDIAVFAPRFESFVLFSSDEKSVGGMLTGIDPHREKDLSRLAGSLYSGRYLRRDDSNTLYIGKELAKRLKVEVGDKLAFIGTGADYSFCADTVIIGGIFQTGLFDFDATASFVNRPYFDEIMVATNLATHFIVLPQKTALAPQLATHLQQQLGNEYRAQSWQETMAGLVEAMEVDSIFGYLTLGIIFIVIFFVILIYTMLNVFARTREIGILRAIGTTPGQILTMLLSENSILGLIGVLGGGLIGGGLAWYFHINPIAFTSFEEQFRQYGLAASTLPTTFAPMTILRDMVIMFVLCMLSTLYPIWKINRLTPTEAMGHV